MAQAIASLPQDQVPANWSPPPSWMIACLALQSAKAAVKQQLQRQGVRVSQVAAKEITARAEEYLAQNRAQLFAETFERIQRSPELKALYDKAVRKYVQRTPKI